MTPISISGPDRDALYRALLIRLSGVGDVLLAVDAQAYERATRLGLEFSDLLRFVSDDLGWGNGPNTKDFKLKTPPDVLRRILDLLTSMADEDDATAASDRAEVGKLEDEARTLRDACGTVRSQLDDAGE
jgi:hypothetical protein